MAASCPGFKLPICTLGGGTSGVSWLAGVSFLLKLRSVVRFACAGFAVVIGFFGIPLIIVRARGISECFNLGLGGRGGLGGLGGFGFRTLGGLGPRGARTRGAFAAGFSWTAASLLSSDGWSSAPVGSTACGASSDTSDSLGSLGSLDASGAFVSFGFRFRGAALGFSA
ncbi:hypothetical protein F5X68DRAFT_211904 [Plectosphaerella plurivora]|uniref:Uncharacterized protein n=1 Tax=Plectosphaerella plurivora TaxID=936078 RepID=A0A9P8V798_9PEZI|nr:hypothetical protein F5X68DRAFT_211904 [Plectosphaerella plurivora]